MVLLRFASGLEVKVLSLGLCVYGVEEVHPIALERGPFLSRLRYEIIAKTASPNAYVIGASLCMSIVDDYYIY